MGDDSGPGDNNASGKDALGQGVSDGSDKGALGKDGSDKGASGKDASDKSEAHPPAGSAIVARSQTPVRDVVVPIFALLSALLFCAGLSKYLVLDCKNYFIVWLAYPLVFGAAGVVFGGAIRLQGKLTLFGVPWTADVLGGVGAALLGFGIVSSVHLPPCVSDLNHELEITDLPLAQPDSDQSASLNYFVTVEPESNLDVQVLPNANNKRTLRIAFKGNYLSRLIFRAYQLDPNRGEYQYLATCEIKFTDDTIGQNSTVHHLQSDQQLTLAFNAEYFSLLKKDIDKNRNLCLKGRFDADNTNNFIFGPAITPLRFQVIQKESRPLRPDEKGQLTLIFATEKPEAVADPKEAAKRAAKDDATIAGEVLTSSGTGAVSPAITTKLDSAPAKVTTKTDLIPLPLSSGCLAGADDVRELVDRFLLGDDLDKDTRRQIYGKWPSINCYVLPLAVDPSVKVSGQVRSRAIKLLTNAIANNSTQADRQYWQPNGAKKRNFALNLPFVRGPDLERIFAQIEMDDDLVRGQAIQFIKTFPIDAFDKLFQNKLTALTGSQAAIPKLQLERYGVAASGLYYNRITDWLNGPINVDQVGAQKSISADFDQSQKWTQETFLNNSAKVYAAMEHYARGIVERELQLSDRGVSDFTAMLTSLKQTNQAYPSRSIHIAQALGIVSGGSDAVVSDILRQIQSADDLGAASSFDDSTPFAGKPFPLYAGPRQNYPKLGAAVETREGGSLLLQSGNWYLVRTSNKIGWVISK
jgi:hypothetical protein